MNSQIKDCDFCRQEFEPKRSDAVYCSATCKTQAYMARKSNESSKGQITGNRDSPVNRKKQSRHNITDSQLSTLINGQKSNSVLLQGLLNEKDSSGDLKSEKGKLEIKMMFLERDLDQLEKDNQSLRDENRKLQLELSKRGQSRVDKLVDSIADNPEQIPALIHTCNSVINSFKNGTSVIGNSQSDNSLSDQMQEVLGLFPGYSLLDLIKLVKSNKELLLTALESQSQSD